MMDDSDLRELFREAREADEASAPDFHRIRSHPKQGHPRSGRVRWGLFAIPAAAALIVALGVLVTGPGSDTPSRQAVPSEASVRTLEEWTAPTDFLLETPGRELLGSFPPIGTSIPEISVTDPSTTPKGA